MIRWANSYAWLFLFLIPILLLLSWLAGKRLQKRLQNSLGKRLLPFLSSSLSTTKRKWKTRLQILVLILMILALARPQGGESKTQIKSQGVEVMMLFDVSESMMCEDLKPNRLTQVKAEMMKFIDLAAGNKMGVIAFAGSAALLSPLTSDPNAIKMYIDSLAPNSVSSQGTNFEEALDAAKEAFERGGATVDDTHKVARVILIVSDGEDQEEGAEKKAKELADQGFRIFTIAYGTEKGGAIPVRDGMGFLKGYKKDRSGQTIITQVHGDELRKLASIGKGKFYFSSFGGDHLRQLLNEISELEKAEFDSQMATTYEERYQIFLLAAVLLALIELLMGVRRKPFSIWKGRFEVPPL